MQCPKCNHENREGAKFCRKCGNALEIICPKCNHHNEPDSMFCDNCGIKFDNTDQVSIPKLEDMHAQLQSMIPDELAQKYMTAEQQATGENRPITALFADISGFTPLSATKSSEAMFQLVQDCFKQLVGIVARYEGSISGFRGDGLLALFGAPILHENDAERAILAGIEMRDMMHSRGLEVSIGINTAMMTVGEIQTQLHKEYTAYGTDVNLAARLQQNADPGQILVGAGTHRLTRRAFDFEIIPDLSLKGFSQTVTAYSVQQMKEHPEKLRGIEGLRARMIGREHEFTEIKESVDQWLSGHGQMVSVIGEAGIGKSRLVSELKTYLYTFNAPLPPSQEGNHNPLNPPLLSGNGNSPFEKGGWGDLKTLTLEGRCVSIGQPISYWPFIDILRTYFNLKEDDDPSAIAQKVTDGTKHVFPNTSDETLPFIGRLLSVRFGNELDNRLNFATPEQIRHQTLMQLRDFFRELANKQPLLLILEDLHWSDELSLDLITYLMDELSHAPLMLLCVYRPEKEQKVWKLGEQAQRKCLDRYTEIMLKRLSSHEGRLLVEELLTIDDLPDSVKNTILEKSEGNPFFIEEVIRSLIEQDMVYRDNDRWRARTEIVNLNVPDTIQSVLLSRVDRLQSEARYVLQCASVIGRLFKYSLLDHLTSQERNLNSYLSEFEDRELVYEERRIPELEYAFKHALTQEATYQSILERRRKEFHHQIAIGIERLYQERIEEYYEELAHHYSMSDDVEKAIEYLLKAGEKARFAYLNDDAVLYFKQVLERINDLPQNTLQKNWQLSALKGLERIYYVTGDMIEAEVYSRKSIELGQEIGLPKNELIILYARLANIMFWQDRINETLRIGEEGLALLGNDTQSFEAALMNSHIAIGYLHGQYNLEKWHEFNLRNLKFIKDLPYSHDLSNTYINIVMMYVIDKNINESMKWLGVFEKLAQQYYHLEALCSVQFCKGYYILNQIGDLHGAILEYEKGLNLALKAGDSKQYNWFLRQLGWLFLELGDVEKALECGYKSLDTMKGFGREEDTAISYTIISISLLCQGFCEKALGSFKEAEKHSKSDKETEIQTQINLGRLYLSLGDRQEAIKRFKISIAYNLQDALCGLEESYATSEEFVDFCHHFREGHPEFTDWSLKQWYLESTKASDFPQDIIYEEFTDALSSNWVWYDQFNDCSFKMQGGLEINASNGRDLCYLNLSAPRILRKASGDFTIQTISEQPSENKPAIGGILIWKDKENYLRLDKGTRGKHEISFSGCIDNKDVIIGRGRLPSQCTFLRLERIGSRVNALCSSNGDEWFTVGYTDLLVDDPVEAGLHAIGMIDRTIYCGEYKEGTATLFRNFRLWTKQ